jgi:hypothetical protein
MTQQKMEARHFQATNPKTGALETVYLWIAPDGNWGWRNPEIWGNFTMYNSIPTTFCGKRVSLLPDGSWVFVA